MDMQTRLHPLAFVIEGSLYFRGCVSPQDACPGCGCVIDHDNPRYESGCADCMEVARCEHCDAPIAGDAGLSCAACLEAETEMIDESALDAMLSEMVADVRRDGHDRVVESIRATVAALSAKKDAA